MTADVTVVMPAMNRAHLIGPALDSIRRQTVQPQAVIVIDDASTDDTVKVAREHGADVITLATNGGSGPARNRGIREATTRWVAFLDSDDIWEPEHLQRVMTRLEEGYVLVSSPAIVDGGGFRGNASRREQSLSPLKALTSDLICTSGTVVRKDALITAGLFRDLRRAQDMDLWIRVLEVGEGLALAQPTVVYGVHEQQAVKDTALMRECVDQIIASCETKPWFRRRDGDRAHATRRWDFAREAQRDRRAGGALRHGGWLAARPHTWGTLAFSLRQRRSARQRSRAHSVSTPAPYDVPA